MGIRVLTPAKQRRQPLEQFMPQKPNGMEKVTQIITSIRNSLGIPQGSELGIGNYYHKVYYSKFMATNRCVIVQRTV